MDSRVDGKAGAGSEDSEESGAGAYTKRREKGYTGGKTSNEGKKMKYVSPIPLPPEVEAEIARAPKRGTPERAAWVNNLREQAWKEGLRRFTTDELLVVMERERAGYDGLGELWGCTLTQTQT